MNTDTLEKTIFLNAPPETVWQYLVDKDKLATWFHPAKDNLAAGEDYALMGKNDAGDPEPICWGRVLEMESPTRLVQTFTIKPLATSETTLVWSLEATQGGTRLHLLHSGIGKASGDAALQMLMALDAGWDKHFGKLRTCAAA